MDESLGAAQQQPMEGRGAAVLLGCLGLVVLVVVAFMGVRGGEPGQPFGDTTQVLVLSVPGLRWQDLAGTETPALDALLGASAGLSTRADGMELDLLEGYLSFNSGNTLAPASSGQGVLTTGADPALCAPELAEAASAGLDPLTGAEVGALGSALRDAGVERRAFGGPLARAALMDGTGCVDVVGTIDEVALGPGVTLIELLGLESIDGSRDRRRTLESHDERLRELAVPDDALVVVMAPVGPEAMADVTVVAVRAPSGPGGADAVLASATTRRSGYLRTTDLAPTLLDVLGVDIPSSMAGTPAVAHPTQSPLEERVALHADVAERTLFRDRTIVPVSAAVVIATLGCALAAAVGRSRLATLSGCMAGALVGWSFLSGLVAYHEVALGVYVTLLIAVSAATAGVVVRAAQRRPWSPVEVLGGLVWLVLIVDVATGGSLQINTPFGYSPSVAGRFQGIGNLAFAVLAATALITALLPARVGGPWGRAAGRGFVIWVGAVSAVVVAAPRLGSDVGGTLALVPAFVVVAALLVRRTAPWAHLVVGGLLTGLGVIALGLLDRSRPSSERTHLGRFVDRLLAGEAGPILRRKLRSNLELFTASVWPMLFLALVVVLAVMGWRRRDRLRQVLDGRAAERALLGGFVTVALLGFLVNDSGIAVPAMMVPMAVPWITLVLLLPHRGRPT